MRFLLGAGLLAVALGLGGCGSKKGIVEVEPMDIEAAQALLGDLRYEVIDVPDGENGFLVLMEVVRAMPEPLHETNQDVSMGGGVPPGVPPGPPPGFGSPRIDPVEQKPQVLSGIDWDEVARALALPIWQPNGEFIDVGAPNYGLMADSKRLAIAGMDDAEIYYSRGDHGAGTEMVLRMWNVADRFGERSPLLIHYLYYTAFRAIVVKGTSEMFDEGLLSDTDIGMLLMEAPVKRGMDMSLETSLRGEVTLYSIPYAASTSVEDILRGLESGGFELDEEFDMSETLSGRLFAGVEKPIDREATIRGMVEKFRRMIETVKAPGVVAMDSGSESESDLPSYLNEDLELNGSNFDQARKEVLKRANPLGEILVEFTMPIYAQAKTALLRNMATERLLMIQFGSRLTGAVDPAGLGLDDELLIDPFSGEAFRFDPTTRWVWSVGDKRLGDDGEVVPNENEVAEFFGEYLRVRL